MSSHEPVVQSEPAKIRFRAAYNLAGNVAVMPNVSRNVLASIGLYELQPNDTMYRAGTGRERGYAREAWRTLVHEAQHSVTPRGAGPLAEAEVARVFEESIATVLEEMHGSKVAKRAGAEFHGLVPFQGTSATPRPGPIAWSAWNKDHLPAPEPSSVATQQGRYTDGPHATAPLTDVVHAAAVGSATLADIKEFLAGTAGTVDQAR